MPNTLTHLLSPHSFSPFSGSFVLGGKKKELQHVVFNIYKDRFLLFRGRREDACALWRVIRFMIYIGFPGERA